MQKFHLEAHVPHLSCLAIPSDAINRPKSKHCGQSTKVSKDNESKTKDQRPLE